MSHDCIAEVLIVDDDPLVQRALKRLLTTNGFPARVFSSAKEFLDQGAKMPAVGCLVLDVKMPGLSGLDLQAELQQRGSRLPIVFITGHGTVPMGVQCNEGRGSGFSAKALRRPNPDCNHPESCRAESSGSRGTE